jgi:protein-S-isoprenylcysteine O-methyltransferase Ste14
VRPTIFWEMLGQGSRNTASAIAGWLWMVLGAVWLVKRFTMKKAKKRETLWEITEHSAPTVLGFWILFENSWKWGWLNLRVLPEVPLVWDTGLLITLVGIAISLWARQSLGGNWSSVVTLKDDHELIRQGPYRWIRHPIYTGILVAVLGTAMIKGHLRGWLGLVILFAGFYFKARREESFLRQEFGAGFEEHTQRTGMFLPKWT